MCSGAAGAGRVEPVPLNIKTGRWVFSAFLLLVMHLDMVQKP